MVFVKTKWGGYHEPPYTEDEILEGARRSNGGVVAFTSFRRPRRPRDRSPEDRKG